jgi:hypothetical protein
MTSLSQAERLARKIGDLVGHPIPDAQAARLAEDYADLCRAASRRLEQCALMIEAAQSLQALQLAETPPPLLDLITVLSFRRANEWRAYCQAHNLHWAEPFYDKYIRLLNETYAKGIAGDHPFYRDYRRAMIKNDDDRAVSILRVIARLNPSDENTREELKRLEEKLVRTKVAALTGALEMGDLAAASSHVARIEASGLPLPSSHPAWQRLQTARCRELLAKAETLRERGAWNEAEALVDEVHALATQNNLQLPASDADLWNSLEEWAGSQRRAYVQDHDFKRAVSALEQEVQTVEKFRNNGVRIKAADVEAAFTALNARWREVEHSGRPLENELADRCEECTGWLQERMASAERRQRAMLAVVALLIIAAIGAVVPLALNWENRRDYIASLSSLESARRVADTQAMVQRIPPKLKSNAAMGAALNSAGEFVSHELALRQNFDDKLAALQKTPATFEQTTERRTEAEKAIASLAPEFQTVAENALANWDSKWKTARNDEISSRLDRAQQFAAGLNPTDGFEAVRTSLVQLQNALSGMDVLLALPPPVDPALDAKFHDLAAQNSHWKAAVQDWERTDASMKQARNFQDYNRALTNLIHSPFATPSQQDAAAEIERLKINDAMLLGELLLPNDRSAWDSLTNSAAWRPVFMPEQPTAEEKSLYLQLRDDKNMHDIYAYELVTNARVGNPYPTHPVFAQGSITRDRGGQETGQVYDPAERRGPVRFLQQTYSDWDYAQVTKLFRTQECDAYERLGLGELIDSNTGNYRKSILQLFDRLNQDENSSAIFRAFVTMKLYEIARMRPMEWGFQWAPDSARHIEHLHDLGAGQLQSGDWMVRDQVAKFEKPLQKYFAEARKVSLENEAESLRQIARQTSEQGFVFAGFIDSEGSPVLHDTTIPAAELWGWDASSSSVQLLFRRASAGGVLEKIGNPMPYTPLLAFPGDRRKILLDAQQAMAQSTGPITSALPPFFSGL